MSREFAPIIRRSLGAVALCAACGVAVQQSLHAPSQPTPGLDPAQREAVAASIAASEPELRARSRDQFPGDHWSQDDAFHAMEQAQIRQAAGQYRVATGAVIDALDAYLRAHPSPEHKPGASPCKPRPFYD